jgi:hypothetical protein
MIQAIILISACLAIWLLTAKKPYSKWGHVVGLIGQPFWFYDSWQHEQWGIFIAAIVFTVSYIKGCYNHILKPKPEYDFWVWRQGDSNALHINLPLDLAKRLVCKYKHDEPGLCFHIFKHISRNVVRKGG